MAARKRNPAKPKPSRPAAKKKRPCSLVQTLRKHAVDVLSVLGKGHTERVYHRAMITSLNRDLIPHRSEVITPICYMGEVVGFGRCDIVIGNLAVEFKANKRRPSKASSQLCKYLESLGRTRYRGVVVNFNQQSGAVEVHHQQQARRR
jgi:GxxExxY protein